MGVIFTAAKNKWTEFILHAINNPKTSLSGLMSFVAITLLAVTPFITDKKATAGAAILSGLVKGWIGFISKDSGSASVVTPSNPIPHSVPSTEIPLDPQATVVTTTTT